MNEQRLMKIIEDMSEVVVNLKECKKVLEESAEDNKTIFIEFGLKQIFVDYFITVENLTSMILKELKKFKIGIDMKESLSILLQNNIIDEEKYIFLNQARLLRNKISYRYKEPSREELLEFINENEENFSSIIDVAKSYL